MTVLAGTDPRDFMTGLAQSRSGRLLRDELGRRWPSTVDRLAAIIRYALLPAGKLIRPIMTLQCAEAVGGDPERVLPAALAMEYVHVATLVHDDIIDADEVRRGRPAVPAAFGVPDAIVTGDHLIFTAFGALVECAAAGLPDRSVGAAVGVLSAAGVDLCRGQVLEAQLVGDFDTGVASYREMVRLKTGALFRAVCHIGAILGGADPDRAAPLAGYGEGVGVAFQIRDDLLAYTTSAATVGKSLTSDLANGRPTLPLLLAYEAGTPTQRADLASALSVTPGGPGLAAPAGAPVDPAVLERVRGILRATGAIERSRQEAEAQARQARAQLSTLEASASVDVLATIAHWAAAPEG